MPSVVFCIYSGKRQILESSEIAVVGVKYNRNATKVLDNLSLQL